MAESLKGYVVGPEDGVIRDDPEVKASRSSTGGVITVIETDTDGGAPPHIHTNEDECFYVVNGSITVTIGEETYEAGPRSFIYLPRGIPHSWDVVGKSAVVLIITVPAGFEDFLREFHEAKGPEERVRISRKYGIQWVRPAREPRG